MVARQVELEQRRQHVDAVVREAEQLVAGEHQLRQLEEQAEVLRHRLDLVVRHVDVLDSLQRRQTDGELGQFVVVRLESLEVVELGHVGQFGQLVVMEQQNSQLLQARDLLRTRADRVVRHVEDGRETQQTDGRRDLVEAELRQRQLRDASCVRVVADVDERRAARVVLRRVQRVGGQVERAHRLRDVERRELVAGDVEREQRVQPFRALRNRAQLVVGEQQRFETAQFAHVRRQCLELVVRGVDEGQQLLVSQSVRQRRQLVLGRVDLLQRAYLANDVRQSFQLVPRHVDDDQRFHEVDVSRKCRNLVVLRDEPLARLESDHHVDVDDVVVRQVDRLNGAQLVEAWRQSFQLVVRCVEAGQHREAEEALR